MTMSIQTARPDAPVLLPVPLDFPVTWADPDEQRLFWTQDRVHAPEPVVPLESALWVLAYDGINPASGDYEMPIRARSRLFNGYLYMAVIPAVSPDQMEAQSKRADARLNEAMGRLEAAWKDEWLPEIQSHLGWWAAFDLRRASMPDLMEHLRETWKRLNRLWHIHFLVVLPAYVAISEFDELYRDLFGGENAFNAYTLLQGLDNKTVQSGRALWALSRKARGVGGLSNVLQQRAPAEIMEALGATSNGRAFREELHAYLETYGQRGDTWGISRRSWIEDPAPVLKNLKDYNSQSDLDLEADQAALASERDRAVQEARDRLKGYPEQVRQRFEFLLKAAQVGTILSEDHGFWIDFSGLYRVRCVFVEVGRRLAEGGALESADDVFYLTLEEALDAENMLRQASLSRSLVAERKGEMERRRRMSAPPVLGTDYGPPPDDPIGRFMTKFFGGPPPASDAPDVVKGHAGSPGKAQGTARVIHSLQEAADLKPGDILVTESTAPPWTPLFATAGGIVTDNGGILSHCAVVAREYRIPAVVGTGRATTTLRTGQLIEVDGDAGTVRVLGG